MRVLRLNQVLEKVGVGKTALYARIKTDGFPRPIKLGPSLSGWVESEVDAWILAQMRARASGG